MESPCADQDVFGQSRERFEEVLAFVGGDGAALLTHAELEDHLARRGRELLRQLYEDHLALRAMGEARLDEVADAEGVSRPNVEAGHRRILTTIFGEVSVCRLAYRQRGRANLHPADAVLNLPGERHSHGLRRLAAVESSKGSFDETTVAIRAASGANVGKRQVEELVRRAAVDFEGFYESSPRPLAEADDVLVISADGKGVVMRPDALRPQTAAAATKARPKLGARLSKGEKRNRKRMAEVGAVYDATPVPRRAEEIFGGKAEASPPPRATGKWLTASLVDNAAAVVATIFDEAERRDPDHQRTWVALVDGNNHQIERIKAEALARNVEVNIVCDFIHVLEYLWRAAWSFFDEGDPKAEEWVKDKALAVLGGQPSTVAASIRRKATTLGLDAGRRANADTCADYLLRKRSYLDYPRALEAGWPIATGVIEGACRHLVKDRLDITGARWGLEGAEAILKLRAIRCNGDFTKYWTYHLAQERRRVHETRYADNVIPEAA